MEAILAAILLLFVPGFASAHELWFVDPASTSLPDKPEIFAQPTAVGVYLASAAAIGFLVLVAARNWHRHSAFVHRLDARVVFPFHARQILAAMIGVDLVWHALGGSLFAPNLSLPTGVTGEFLKWSAVATGMGLIFFEYFWFELSILLFFLFASLAIVAGPEAFVQQLFFAGAALFLAVTSPRTWATKPISILTRQRAYAVFRVFTGITLLSLSAVKWFLPELGMQLLHEHPALNALGAAGVDDGTFLYMIALIETLGGLALIFNLFIRWFSMILVPVFTLTAFILGERETIGHLPMQAALAVFILYGHTYIPKYKTHIEIHGRTTQISETLPV